MIEQLRIIILKKNCIRKWHIAVKHLHPYFLTNFVKFGSLEIWRIQIQIYPKTNVELKYGAFYLKNKVSAYRLGLVVQLSLRVAPPLKSSVVRNMLGALLAAHDCFKDFSYHGHYNI